MEESKLLYGFMATPMIDPLTLRSASQNNGGLTTSRGKPPECGDSGEGGLVLTSLTVDSVSMAGWVMTREEGGAMFSACGLKLDRLKDNKMKVTKIYTVYKNINIIYCKGLRQYPKFGKKLPVASLLCLLKMGRGGWRSGGS